MSQVATAMTGRQQQQNLKVYNYNLHFECLSLALLFKLVVSGFVFKCGWHVNQSVPAPLNLALKMLRIKKIKK